MFNTLRHWGRDQWRYPKLIDADASYDEYWARRDLDAPLNSFQCARIDFIASRLHEGDVVLDVGCGDGRILAALKERVAGVRVLGIDSSSTALERAKRRGIDVSRADIRIPSSLATETADWTLLLEVVEHMPNSEELLSWAVEHAQKGVIFSVPNTGFLTHRLRLLMGRFPLQWRAHPAEHVRFWTLRDMHWWMQSLGYRYEIHAYEGVPLLSRMWPALFAAGLIIVIPRHSDEPDAR